MREKMYITYAQKAVVKVIEINKVLSGTECPEEESLLGDVYYCIADLIKECLSQIVGRIDNDKLNNMTTEIMFEEEGQIDSIVEKYCGLDVGS